MIVIHIHETHLAVGGEGFRSAGIEVISLKLAILPVQKAVPVGRDSESTAADQLAFQYQRAFTRCSVDAIDIGSRGLVVGDVSARVASTAQRPSAATSRSRMVSSASLTNLVADTSKAWRKVKFLSWSARIICSD